MPDYNPVDAAFLMRIISLLTLITFQAGTIELYDSFKVVEMEDVFSLRVYEFLPQIHV